MIGIEVNVSGPLAMLAKIKSQVQPKAVDKTMETKVGDVLRASFDQQFDQAGMPNRWQPLAPSTIAEKKRLGYPRRNRKGKPTQIGTQRGSFGPDAILIRTGELRVSWTKAGSPENVCKSSAGILDIGSSNSIAIYHQSDKPRKGGGRNGGPRLPRRPLVITDEALALCADAIAASVFAK